MGRRLNQQPIGVFDSGIGGLSVLKEIVKLLPNENIIYLGDTARRPYGVRDTNTLIQCVVENTELLASLGVKLVVVACHTASMMVDKVKKDLPLPVIDMVDSTSLLARAARCERLGLIGTTRTVNDETYYRNIYRLDKQVKVYGLACPNLVTMVEDKEFDNQSKVDIGLTIMKGLGIDTLILACTHFPFISHLIARAVPNTQIVNPGRAVASHVFRTLKEREMLNGMREQGKVELIFTGGENVSNHS